MIPTVGSYPSVEMNSVYSTAPTNWAPTRVDKKFITNIVNFKLQKNCLYPIRNYFVHDDF